MADGRRRDRFRLRQARAGGRALTPRVAGWLSHEDPGAFLLKGSGHLRYERPIRSSIDFLESGSSSTLSMAALDASLDTLLALTPEAILAHVARYHDALEPKLGELGFRSLELPSERGDREH